MYEELDVGQVQDWQQYHRQFNLCFDKTDNFWAMLLAMFRNAHKGESSGDMKPVDFLHWVDQYADEDEFLAQIRAFAATVQKTEG